MCEYVDLRFGADVDEQGRNLVAIEDALLDLAPCEGRPPNASAPDTLQSEQVALPSTDSLVVECVGCVGDRREAERRRGRPSLESELMTGARAGPGSRMHARLGEPESEFGSVGR